jgi:DNA-binding NarL/FixJ family response regulator
VDPDLPAVEALPLFRPEVVIWDLGWTADPELDSRGPDRWGPLLAYMEAGAAVLVLLGRAGTAAELWAGGIRGLLPRQTTGAGLARPPRRWHRGGRWWIRPGGSALGGRPAGTWAAGRADRRELEVLQAAGQKACLKSIAPRLAISEHTVKFHVNAILRKLEAQSRTEAVVQATRLGLILL